jgi:hypothetical protein
MAEYYEESRNEGPNILGMAGLLGLGALAGAGGYYALRNAKGRSAAAEALTRASRSERPRGVQMGDLSSRVTGDFGYDPRITGNTQLPNRRPTRVTGDMGANINPRPVAPHAPEQYSNVPPSVPPTTPTSELRSQVYANVAAKPESELPRVYKPQGGTTEEMLITDPNTGEIYRRGGGGSYFASKAAELAGNIVTDLPEVVASAPRERMVRRQGRMVPLSSLQQKQPAIPTGTVDLNTLETQSIPTVAPAVLKGRDVDLALNAKGLYLSGNPYDNEFIINTDKGGSYQLKHPFSSHPKESIRQTALEEERIAQDLLARAGISLEQAQEARFSHYERSFGGNPDLQNQTTSAVESGASQQEGRVWQQLSRNEDLDKTQIAQLEAQADADYKAMMGSNPSEWSGVEGDVAINKVAQALPDGLPIDQAEGVTVRDLVSQGKPVLDLRQRQAVRISPRALGLEQEQDPLTQEALQYLRAKEIDTDFDYSAENMRQAAQVRDRVERAQALQNEANQILAGLQAKGPVINEQLSPQEFAASFNKKYREELNPELQLVDNSRQRQGLRGAQTGVKGEDVVSLLLGDVPEVESTMRGKALRGGKLNRAGDISYMDESGQEYASADTGVKARQGQGVQYKEQVLLTNEVKPLLVGHRMKS